MDDEFALGDDEDFGFGLGGAPTLVNPNASRAGGFNTYDGSQVGGGTVFPAVDDGMVPIDSDLLFDEIGNQPMEQSPIAAMAAMPVSALPSSLALGGAGAGPSNIKAALGNLLTLRSEARFKRYAVPAAVAVSGPPAVVPSSPASPVSLAGAAFPNSAAPAASVAGANAITARWQQKRRRSVPWTDAETSRFYDALRQFGTNLALVAMLFPGRDRVDVLRKYHHEQRTQPRVLSAALDKANERPIDLAAFETQSHEWARQHMMRRAAPLGEDDISIMNELAETEHAKPPQPPPSAPTARPPKAETADTAGKAAAAAAMPRASDDDDGFGMDFQLFSSDELPQQTGAAPGMGSAQNSTASQFHMLEAADDDTPFAAVLSGSPTTATKTNFDAAAAPPESKKRNQTTAGSGKEKSSSKRKTKSGAAIANPPPPTAAFVDGDALAEQLTALEDTAGGFDLFDHIATDGQDDDAAL